VKNTSASDVTERIDAMAQQILSRSTLNSLITTYKLYKDDLKTEPMEDVVTKMRAAISIRPTVSVTNIQNGKGLPAMQVQFSYRDRNIARQVCADLVSRFMNENTQAGIDVQTSANSFIKDQFDRSKRELDEAEQKLSDYRVRNDGKLPEQMNANVSQMNALEGRLGSLQDAIVKNNEHRQMLETSLQIAKDRLASLKNTPVQSVTRNEKLMETEKEMETLESTIASMKDRYTDDYPDLQAARDRLAVLKRQRDEAIKNPPKADGVENVALNREKADAQAAVDMIQGQIKATDIEERSDRSELAALSGTIRGYQGRVEQAPAGEKEYDELRRDRDLAREKYEKLEVQMHEASMSLDLERRRQGETLELLDEASMPTSPTAPKRSMIIPVGLIGGLLIGILLVAIREVRDTSLKNLKDARLYTQLSILGSIPLLENDVVVQRRKQVMWVGWATATIVGLAMMIGSVAHYYMSKA
jgi:uncharacterized protein involved in exopolysaccharide biosynthesis